MRALAARLALPLAVFGVLCALHLFTLLRAPAAWFPAEISVRLRPGEMITLGTQELATPRAAERQLALRRDASGAWWVRNLDAHRALELRAGDTRRRSADMALAPGQRLHAGAVYLTVTSASNRELRFEDGSHRWQYDGAALLRDGMPQPACPDMPVAARLTTLWNRAVPHALTLARPLILGGNLNCANRIAIAGMESGAAALYRSEAGRFTLSVRGRQPVLAAHGNTWEDLAQREHALADVDALALGRTVLAVRHDGATLLLRPAGQVRLSASPYAHLPGGVAWRWQQRSTWTIPAPPPLAWVGALAVLAALAAGMAGHRGPDGRFRLFCAGLLACCAWLLLVTQRTVGAPGPGISMLLAWGALLLALTWARRPRLLPTSAVLLLGIGLLVQLDMGLGAPDTAWLRHFQNTCALLGLGLPASLALFSGTGRTMSRSCAEIVLLVLAVLALAALLLQVWFGSETGVFDVQPVEFAKLALAALSAHCLALAAGSAGEEPRGWRFWLRVAAPVLLFVVLLGAALVRVDDYSPLVLLLVWAGGMGLAWCCATRRRAAAVALACCAGAALFGAAALQGAADTLGNLGFYSDRFAVWDDPLLHPHSGQQMLLAARAVAEGGWLGVDGLLGMSALGQSAGQALAIPAVQDDFAPAYLAHRHGLVAAMLLWCAQALFMVSLLRSATRAWNAAAAAGDFRRAWLGRFRCFALCGGAAFVAGHLLLSWGTNFAMFPIMGQPMSFLSSGGSHLLFFICPLLAFGMASTHHHEESRSCRSMSNMKY